MNIEITTRKKYPVADEVLFRLFQRSFQQWSDNGIVAQFLSQDIEYFKRATRRASVVLAFMVNGEGLMVNDGDPVGMLCVNCYKDKHAFDFYLTVAPEAKQMGVGTRMLEYAVMMLKERGYRYMTDTTSVHAVWSVRWHLKNGYRIVGFGKGRKPYSDTYQFREQIAGFSISSPSTWLWNGPVVPVTAKCCYLFWRMVRWLTQRQSDGEYNWLGRMLRKVRRKK